MNNQDAIHTAIAAEVKRDVTLQCVEALHTVYKSYHQEHFLFLLTMNDPTGMVTFIEALEYIVTHFKGIQDDMQQDLSEVLSYEDAADMKELMERAIAKLAEEGKNGH